MKLSLRQLIRKAAVVEEKAERKSISPITDVVPLLSPSLWCARPVLLDCFSPRLNRPCVRRFLNVISAEQSLRLQHSLAGVQEDWVLLRGRRCLKLGGDVTEGGLICNTLPRFLQSIVETLAAEVFPSKYPPNHVLVNDYEPGDGIMPHNDGPLYHPLVAILSLRSACMFEFWRSTSCGEEVLLPVNSLLVFEGEAYESWKHGVNGRRFDEIGAEESKSIGAEERLEGDRNCIFGESELLNCGRLKRGRRVSLTIRHVPEAVPRRSGTAGG